MAFRGPTLPAEGAQQHPVQSRKEVPMKAGPWSCFYPERADGDPQKTGLSLATLSVLIVSEYIHQTSYSWKYPLCLG